MDEIHRRYHEVANIFPLMTGADFDALKADIAEYGLREPIWLHPDGSIIDGRNRHRACVELGIDPDFETWNGQGSLVAFVVSLNLHRRHLDAGQRAMIGLTVKSELAKEIAIEKAEKGRAAVEKRWYGPDIGETGGALFQDESIGFVHLDKTYTPDKERDARIEAASAVQVSNGTMARAEQVAKHSPELAAKVTSGEMKLNAAYREVQHQQKTQAPPLPTNKYRVWYADPPWRYNDSRMINDNDSYGAAERHYPTMSIAELCAMGAEVKAQSDENAVLFLWVTAPLLEECFQVIRAWGFHYKTCFVWDKIGSNFGNYHSARHELLMVCTRGSCTPDRKELFDSVISIQKSRRHSEKPEEFRRIIDDLYTWGNRIELFARATTDNWDTWGNEAVLSA